MKKLPVTFEYTATRYVRDHKIGMHGWEGTQHPDGDKVYYNDATDDEVQIVVFSPLRSLNMPGFYITVKDGAFFHIKAGPFTEFHEAATVANVLGRMGV